MIKYAKLYRELRAAIVPHQQHVLVDRLAIEATKVAGDESQLQQILIKQAARSIAAKIVEEKLYEINIQPRPDSCRDAGSVRYTVTFYAVNPRMLPSRDQEIEVARVKAMANGVELGASALAGLSKDIKRLIDDAIHGLYSR